VDKVVSVGEYYIVDEVMRLSLDSEGVSVIRLLKLWLIGIVAIGIFRCSYSFPQQNPFRMKSVHFDS
jgi:hypothetical protein